MNIFYISGVKILFLINYLLDLVIMLTNELRMINTSLSCSPISSILTRVHVFLVSLLRSTPNHGPHTSPI